METLVSSLPPAEEHQISTSSTPAKTPYHMSTSMSRPSAEYSNATAQMTPGQWYPEVPSPSISRVSIDEDFPKYVFRPGVSMTLATAPEQPPIARQYAMLTVDGRTKAENHLAECAKRVFKSAAYTQEQTDDKGRLSLLNSKLNQELQSFISKHKNEARFLSRSDAVSTWLSQYANHKTDICGAADLAPQTPLSGNSFQRDPLVIQWTGLKDSDWQLIQRPLISMCPTSKHVYVDYPKEMLKGGPDGVLNSADLTEVVRHGDYMNSRIEEIFGKTVACSQVWDHAKMGDEASIRTLEVELGQKLRPYGQLIDNIQERGYISPSPNFATILRPLESPFGDSSISDTETTLAGLEEFRLQPWVRTPHYQPVHDREGTKVRINQGPEANGRSQINSIDVFFDSRCEASQGDGPDIDVPSPVSCLTPWAVQALTKGLSKEMTTEGFMSRILRQARTFPNPKSTTRSEDMLAEHVDAYVNRAFHTVTKDDLHPWGKCDLATHGPSDKDWSISLRSIPGAPTLKVHTKHGPDAVQDMGASVGAMTVDGDDTETESGNFTPETNTLDGDPWDRV